MVDNLKFTCVGEAWNKVILLLVNSLALWKKTISEKLLDYIFLNIDKVISRWIKFMGDDGLVQNLFGNLDGSPPKDDQSTTFLRLNPLLGS